MHLDSDKSEHLNPHPYQNGMNILISIETGITYPFPQDEMPTKTTFIL